MRAVLICFSIKSRKFKNNYERCKFFKALYGWKQIIPKKKKTYVYERNGLLDKIPHVKVDQSSFIIPKSFFDEINDFLRKWEDKIIWKHFEVLINKEFEKLLEEFEKEFEG